MLRVPPLWPLPRGDIIPGLGPLDSCHSRMIRNQQNLYPNFPPTAVVKLVQYISSKVEHMDGFSLHKLFTVKLKNGEFNLDFGVLIKTGGVMVGKLKFK